MSERDEAVRQLRSIAARADISQGSFSAESLSRLKHEAAGIAGIHLGSTHHIVRSLQNLDTKQTLAFSSFSQTMSTSEELIGLINAAVTSIPATDGTRARPQPSCDPDLWAHVEELVEIESWGKIPAAVATFVEHWFRERGGDPRDDKGRKVVGTTLLGQVLNDYALGGQSSEQEGWLLLGKGLVLAIGNLHRHNIEVRPDAEQVAWGAIGLGSLLIGEMKHTYPI